MLRITNFLTEKGYHHQDLLHAIRYRHAFLPQLCSLKLNFLLQNTSGTSAWTPPAQGPGDTYRPHLATVCLHFNESHLPITLIFFFFFKFLTHARLIYLVFWLDEYPGFNPLRTVSLPSSRSLCGGCSWVFVCLPGPPLLTAPCCHLLLYPSSSQHLQPSSAGRPA